MFEDSCPVCARIWETTQNLNRITAVQLLAHTHQKAAIQIHVCPAAWNICSDWGKDLPNGATAITWSSVSMEELVVDYKHGCCSKEAPNSEALYATNTSTTWYTEDPVCLLLLIYGGEWRPDKHFCRTLWWHTEFNLWPFGYKMSWNHLHLSC